MRNLDILDSTARPRFHSRPVRTESLNRRNPLEQPPDRDARTRRRDREAARADFGGSVIPFAPACCEIEAAQSSRECQDSAFTQIESNRRVGGSLKSISNRRLGDG